MLAACEQEDASLYSRTASANKIERAKRLIAKTRLDFVRLRAMQVCVGLQSLRLDALQLCEILQFACGAVASVIPFHHWWKLATTVKHFVPSGLVE